MRRLYAGLRLLDWAGLTTLTATLNCPGVNQVHAYCHSELSVFTRSGKCGVGEGHWSDAVKEASFGWMKLAYMRSCSLPTGPIAHPALARVGQG